MRLIYNLAIYLYRILLRLLAPYHRKAGQMVGGRRHWRQEMKQTIEQGHKYVWFHFASLGEFEQGRPVLEAIRSRHTAYKIIVTFYSPSGYEVRKNTVLADYVFYLPYDTKRNAHDFLELAQPILVVFTKYEYWYYYFNEIKRRDIPLLLISAIFRPDQIFFQPYGGFFRKILSRVTYFFVQNQESLLLLKEIGIRNAGVAGDTRFDRVVALPTNGKRIVQVEDFVDNRPTLIAGSTWPEDERILFELLQDYPEYKFVVAPHEIGEERIRSIIARWSTALRFSCFTTYTQEEIKQASLLIIDNIGMLSTLYGYGQIAYIGGGFGVGIHNTLEAAAYGMPVIFGPNYQKFQEARDLIELEAAFSIKDKKQLEAVFGALQSDEVRVCASTAARQYVVQHAGATAIVMKYLDSYLK